MKQKTEEKLQAIKNEIESLYEALEKSNKEKVMLKNSQSDMPIMNEVFFKKLVEVEDQKKHCREYQCALCDYISGYMKETLHHMSANHMEMDKKTLC